MPKMEWDSIDSAGIYVDPEKPERKASPVGQEKQETQKKPENEPVKEELKAEPVPDILLLPKMKEEPKEEPIQEDDKTVLSKFKDLLRPADMVFVEVESKASGVSVETILAQRRLVPESVLLERLSKFFHVPLAKDIAPSLTDIKNNTAFFVTHNILPCEGNIFVIDSPRDQIKIEKLLFSNGYEKPKLKLSSEKFIKNALRSALLTTRDTASVLYEKTRTLVDQGLYAKCLDLFLRYAFQVNASDIHFELSKTRGVVRMRVNGVLEYVTALSVQTYERIIIALYQRLGTPQPSSRESGDGAFVVEGLPLQVRTSLYPSLFSSHHAVLRLLYTNGSILSGQELGYEDDIWNRLVQTAKMTTSGIILYVGPTGSGKNASLLSLVSELDTVSKKLIEVADPIEYQHMLGIQAQLTETDKNDWTYAEALRASLRHDPDIILIAEIRDTDSAKIALDAARTGHTILSTVHAESVFEAFDRLQDLGCNMSYLLSTVKAVVSQRLLRKACQKCHGSGCSHCFNGYTGRYAVPELLVLNEKFRTTCNGSLPNTKDAREALGKELCEGYVPLLEKAKMDAEQGKTTMEEVARVLGE